MSTVYTINGKVLKNAANDKWLTKKEEVDPYNPLGLPLNTVRVRTSDGNAPSYMGQAPLYNTATLVAGTNDVYDVYKSGTSFEYVLYASLNVVEIIGANTEGIINVNSMFWGCTNVQSGALELYQQFSSQPVPPSNHSQTFYNCGSNTTTGAAELAQIPSDWK